MLASHGRAVKFRTFEPIAYKQLRPGRRIPTACTNYEISGLESVSMLNFSMLPQSRQESGSSLPAVELKPRRLEQWLQTLPERDPAKSVQKLLEAISRLNAKELPHKVRQDLLDVYRPWVNGLFEAFDSSSFQRQAARANKTDQATEDIAALISALADGYKLIVGHQHKKGVSARGNERLRRAIYCAMEQTIHRLLHAYRLYLPVPKHIHHELHWLYRFGEKQRVLYVPVTLEGRQAASESVGKLYKQFLLLCIADPHHLGRQEVLELFRSFSRYATAAQLRRGEDWKSLHGHFVVDLAQDDPPLPLAQASSERQLHDPRVFDTSAVVTAAIRDQINEGVSERHKLNAEWGKRLVAKIVPDFQGISPRKEAREPASRSISVAIGIEAVHYFIGDGKHQLAGHQTDSSTVDIRDARHRLNTLDVTDEAPGGYGLKGGREDLTDTQTGELLGIVEQAQNNVSQSIRLAVVRWIRADDDDSLLLGTELIDAPAIPVSCQKASRRGSTRLLPLACLLLSGTRDGSVPPTLLCPKGIYSEGLSLKLIRGEKTVLVRMNNRVMDTPCFDRFHFQQKKPLDDARPT